MRFVLADSNLVVAGMVYEGFPLLIDDDGDAIQPAQSFLWHLLPSTGRIQSKKTWEAYGRAIYDFFAYSLTNHLDWRAAPTSDHPGAIEAWRDWSRGTLGLSARTINQRMRVVIRFYKWAEQQGYIERVPFDYVTVQTSREPGFLAHVDASGGKMETPAILLSEEQRTIRFLTKEQIDLCHKTLVNPTHQLMFELMVRTGLRQIECRSFPDAYTFDPSRRKDLRAGAKFSLYLDPKHMDLKREKPRDIDMPYDLMEKLWIYSVRQRQVRANNHPEAKELPHLFLTEGGVPYSRNAVTAIFAKLSQRVGFKVTAHMLRHSYATYLLWSLDKSPTFQGEPILYVCDRMGHSNVSTTYHYLHLIRILKGQLVLAHEDEIDQLFSSTVGNESS
ncbi:tyrosine-type recombinase/integrase [Comamonas testosteroni]|uniref:Integrase n=1 Tax=Comamonas testosteroni TaxID=285 RepID=A0A096FKY4_COMTE|nr:site-specific integrase [Comamonas testosteroni]KGH30574.1 hypothetical protein P353_10475 [Comamonas testosteroni]